MFVAGIERYHWCLGSKQAYCDITPYTETTEQEASTRQHDALHLVDGHPVYVSVQVREIDKRLCKENKFQKSEITMEVGGWVQVSLGFLVGNRRKIALNQR